MSSRGIECLVELNLIKMREGKGGPHSSGPGGSCVQLNDYKVRGILFDGGTDHKQYTTDLHQKKPNKKATTTTKE